MFSILPPSRHSWPSSPGISHPPWSPTLWLTAYSQGEDVSLQRWDPKRWWLSPLEPCFLSQSTQPGQSKMPWCDRAHERPSWLGWWGCHREVIRGTVAEELGSRWVSGAPLVTLTASMHLQRRPEPESPSLRPGDGACSPGSFEVSFKCTCRQLMTALSLSEILWPSLVEYVTPARNSGFQKLL